jgi:3-oxoacyl-[acyl-carrier protein] reductase
LAKTLSMELASKSIRINTLCPGLIETPRLDRADQAGPAEQASSLKVQDVLKTIPLGRTGRPEEVAAIAVFLASPLASYITGTTLAVDGGGNRSLL